MTALDGIVGRIPVIRVEEPETVQVQLEVGERRMCLALPRGGKFVAEKQLVRVKAAQAPACPAE